MLGRLILVLLMAAFSLPAAASTCHDAAVSVADHAMPMQQGDHQPAPAPEAPFATHGCVGCVPPSDLLGARIAPPLPVPAAAPAERVATLDLGGTAPPDLPPPRRD